MKKYFLIFSLLMLVFVSCEDVIPVKLNNENLDLFYVEAKITTQDKPFVFLSKGLTVNADQPFNGISDAQITISDNAQPSNIATLVEDKIQKGYYSVPENVDYYGVTGREYMLTIEYQGITLQAKDFLAPVSPIDSIYVGTSKMGGPQFLSIFAFAQETPGLGNYYKWDIYVNDTLQNDAMNMAIASDELVDGNYVNDLEIFVDFHDPKKKADRKLNFMDTIYVKQNSLSLFAYNFYTQMMSQSQSGGLFSVLPANVKGNFTSGDGKIVLGMFTAQDVSISKSVIIDESVASQLKE